MGLLDNPGALSGMQLGQQFSPMALMQKYGGGLSGAKLAQLAQKPEFLGLASKYVGGLNPSSQPIGMGNLLGQGLQGAGAASLMGQQGGGMGTRQKMIMQMLPELMGGGMYG